MRKVEVSSLVRPGLLSIVKKRIMFAIFFLLLLVTEVLIGMFAYGWVRNYLGDVLVVILLYALVRLISPEKPAKWYILPTIILILAFIVEFLQLWGFCDRFGITNRLLRIIIGTGFSGADLLSYTIGIIPCYVADYFFRKIPLQSGLRKDDLR